MRIRAKNLKDDDIFAIVTILDTWSGPLSWSLLIEKIEKHQFASYTRQALHKHERIRVAFVRAKNAPAQRGSTRSSKNGSPELTAALERLERLDAANRRLRDENGELLEQFVRWAYNAHSRGLGIGFLNQALPSVFRDQTEMKISHHNLKKVGKVK